MPTTTLRSATIDDVPLILELIQALAEYERLPEEAVATAAGLRDTLFGAQPAAEVLIAEVDGESAGFALFFHTYSTFLGRRGIWLEDLFVRPTFRGHGVGRLLLSRLAAIAIARDCGRLEWSVLDWNVDAIGFYQKLGAVAMDEWTTNRVTGAALVALASPEGG